MVELIVERWSNPDGSVNFLWSLWAEGKRVHMGGPFRSAEASEAAGVKSCQERMGQGPDRVTRL